MAEHGDVSISRPEAENVLFCLVQCFWPGFLCPQFPQSFFRVRKVNFNLMSILNFCSLSFLFCKRPNTSQFTRTETPLSPLGMERHGKTWNWLFLLTEHNEFPLRCPFFVPIWPFACARLFQFAQQSHCASIHQQHWLGLSSTQSIQHGPNLEGAAKCTPNTTNVPICHPQFCWLHSCWLAKCAS